MKHSSQAAETSTFFFSDIVGSTRLLGSIGPHRYAELLEDYRARVRSAVERNHGHGLELEGDGCFAIFDTASDAVAAAVDLQTALLEADSAVRVRVGINTGEAHSGAESIVGIGIHRAQRIASAAHGGQILLSEVTKLLAEPELREGTGFKDLGQHRLKDFGEAERLFQVTAPAIDTEFPPVVTLSSHPNNLPVQLTQFIGRKADIETIRSLIERNRLVTVVGPGGVGKTRVALETAGSLLEQFSDGVIFVDLASLAEASMVAATVAAHLGVPEAGDALHQESGTTGRELQHLTDRALLLILDNCEQVRSACATIAHRLLTNTRQMRVLATSRELLGVPGEQVMPLSPFPVGDLKATESEAVQLFINRAKLQDPQAEFSQEQMSAISEICRLLDGLPLGIELAAAGLRMQSLEEMRDRLSDSVAAMEASSHIGPVRHQTLLAAIDWGYALLTEEERILLSRLSVFAGGFTLEAATRVCEGSGVTSEHIPRLLASLVDKSLVFRNVRAGKTRYYLLDTIRYYGLDKMMDPDSEAYRAFSEMGESVLFRREGDYWRIGREGADFLLKDAKGLRYLETLLRAPGHPVFVLDLVDTVEGAGAEERATRRASAGAGEVIDQTARSAYKKRVQDLEGELEEASRFNDLERVARLQEEIDAVKSEVARSVGVGGRPRVVGSTAERARVSVTKAIRSSISRIEELDRELGRHLDRAIRTGTTSTYSPDESERLSWVLS